jgi:hypothetical protein
MPRCWPDLDCWDLRHVGGSSNPLKSDSAALTPAPLRRGFFTQDREKPAPGRRASGLATTSQLPRALPAPLVPKLWNSNSDMALLFFAPDAVKPLTFAVRSANLR